MESLFGTDFADVRVHVGPQAAAIGALAFTHGSDIYFAPGHYDPLSRRGLRILGHELTHVVQQREGRARNPFGAGVAVVQNQALEAEAERMGSRAAAVPSPHERGRGPAAIQRMRAGGAAPLSGPAGRSGARPAGLGGRPLRGSPLLSARRVIQPIFEEDLRAVSLAARAYGYSKGAAEIQELQSMYLDGSVVVTSNYPGDLAQVEALLFPGKRQERAVNMSATLTTMIGSASLHQPKRRYSYFAFEQIGSEDLFEGATKTDKKVAEEAETFVRDRLIANFATSAFANITTVVPCKSSTACATALDKPHQLIILQGTSTSGTKIHAEQLLLEVLAHRLKAGKVPTQLGIHGTKYACSKCQTALSCF
ncbi:MAG TPA: DUF4157 domain-containing protein, partial [Pyrinomonadaceae bacterium]|nr:DUF4157 domain-containing protein [Pyrinomonadaceae bacterium]